MWGRAAILAGMDFGVWGVVAGGLLFASGAALGVLAAGMGLRGGRVRQLGRELREERERAAGYRDSVAKHFGDTSDRFRDLTREYTALYAHLAEGARELCAERVPQLGRGFAGAGPLEIAEPDPETPVSAAS